MRNLFLVLVLANLAFAAWQLWLAPRPRSHPADDLPGITLVSEVPSDLRTNGAAPEVVQSVAAPSATTAARSDDAAAPVAAPPTPGAVAATKPAGPDAGANAAPGGAPTPSAAALPSAAASAVEAASPPPERCTSIGPFRELAQAATAAANLRTAGYQPTQRVADGEIWIGYWVYIDAIPTEPRANEILANVRDHGITDSYVIPNSDSGNLVSLGVFSEISGVVRRRDAVRALGYEPRVVDRTRRATVYWVDVLLAAEQTLDVDSLQTPGRIVRLEQRPCPAPGP